MPIYERLQKLNHNPKTNTKKFKILKNQIFIYLFIRLNSNSFKMLIGKNGHNKRTH